MRDREASETAHPGPETEPTPSARRRGWRRVDAPPRPGRFEARAAIDPTPPPWTRRRREPRIPTRLRVRTMTVDPVRDPVTQALHYQTNEADGILDVSRRGLRLRCARPPIVGTRILMQFQLAGDDEMIELIGATRWTRVEYVPGELGARAIAAVGIELMSGSPRALRHYEQQLSRLERAPRSVAGPQGLR